MNEEEIFFPFIAYFDSNLTSKCLLSQITLCLKLPHNCRYLRVICKTVLNRFLMPFRFRLFVCGWDVKWRLLFFMQILWWVNVRMKLTKSELYSLRILDQQFSVVEILKQMNDFMKCFRTFNFLFQLS